MEAAIIGAGPAGLMAAEMLSSAGIAVEVFDAMPSPARKFLRAGIGGLNLTHAEDFEAFLSRYGARQEVFRRLLAGFGPTEQRQWARDLGIETFVGSSGRVFPMGMKAAPLLRAWLRRLGGQGARLHTRHRWTGWDGDYLCFANGARVRPKVTVLALGGASWPQLGADGAWTELLPSTPLKPANCGFDVAWSPHFRDRFAGQPVKSVGLSFGGRRLKGEFVITATGLEGSAIYALSSALRDAEERVLMLDLKPDWSAEKLATALTRPRGSLSLSTWLDKALGLKGVAAGLLRELGGEPSQIKALPLKLGAPRPLAEAISTAGGVPFEELDETLMLRARPGVFLAGEMLDWEAPTGGYLLTGCLATGRVAGLGAVRFLAPG